MDDNKPIVRSEAGNGFEGQVSVCFYFALVGSVIGEGNGFLVLLYHFLRNSSCFQKKIRFVGANYANVCKREVKEVQQTILLVLGH